MRQKYMDDEEDNYGDFKIDPLKLEAAKYLLSQGKNYSEIAVAMSIDRHTVAKVRERMNEGSKIRSSGRDEERRERVPTEEYQNILKMVKGLMNRVKDLEGKYDEQIRLYNILANFLNSDVAPRLNIVRDEFRNISENITKNARNIGYLQRDVNIFKEIKKVEFREAMEKSEKRQRERDIAHEEAGQRAVENMEEERRKKEQGDSNAFFQKLKELKEIRATGHFAVVDNVVIASAPTKKELDTRVAEILPKEKKEWIHQFRI